MEQGSLSVELPVALYERDLHPDASLIFILPIKPKASSFSVLSLLIIFGTKTPHKPQIKKNTGGNQRSLF